MDGARHPKKKGGSLLRQRVAMRYAFKLGGEGLVSRGSIVPSHGRVAQSASAPGVSSPSADE